jgi:hypothetical protein
MSQGLALDMPLFVVALLRDYRQERYEADFGEVWLGTKNVAGPFSCVRL